MIPNVPFSTPPVESPLRPNTPLPAGSCDAHVHLVGDDFPLWEKAVERPEAGTLDDWLGRFMAHQSALGFTRTVVVHSILYGADNSITLEAVRRLGPAARGIALLPDGAGPAQIAALAEACVAGIRLNYVHGGILTWKGARDMAPCLAEHGMHLQMLLHSHLHITELADDIRALPVPLVLDHIGWPDLSLGPSDPGFAAMLALMEEGHVWVKLSAAYRLCDPPHETAAPFIETLIRANPERCLWGTDWPHLMLADAALPDAGQQLQQFLDIAGRTGDISRILVENPEKLYGFDPSNRLAP